MKKDKDYTKIIAEFTSWKYESLSTINEIVSIIGLDVEIKVSENLSKKIQDDMYEERELVTNKKVNRNYFPIIEFIADTPKRNSVQVVLNTDFNEKGIYGEIKYTIGEIEGEDKIHKTVEIEE